MSIRPPMRGGTLFVDTVQSTTAVPEGQAPPPSNFDEVSVTGDHVVTGTSTVGVLFIDPYQVLLNSCTYSTPGTVTAQVPDATTMFKKLYPDKNLVGWNGKLYAQVTCVGAGGSAGTAGNSGPNGDPCTFIYKSNVVTANGGSGGSIINGGSGGIGSVSGTGITGPITINKGGDGGDGYGNSFNAKGGGGGSAGTPSGPGAPGNSLIPNRTVPGYGVQVGTFGGPTAVVSPDPLRAGNYSCGGGSGSTVFGGGGGGAWVCANVLVGQGEYTVTVPDSITSGQGACFVQFYIDCNSQLITGNGGLNISSGMNISGTATAGTVKTSTITTGKISGVSGPAMIGTPYVLDSELSFIPVPAGVKYISCFCVGGGGGSGPGGTAGGISNIVVFHTATGVSNTLVTATGGNPGLATSAGSGGYSGFASEYGSYGSAYQGGSGGLTTTASPYSAGGGGGAGGFGGPGGDGGTNGSAGVSGSAGSGGGGGSSNVLTVLPPPTFEIFGGRGGGTSNAYNVATNAGGGKQLGVRATGNQGSSATGYGGGAGGQIKTGNIRYSGGGGGALAQLTLAPIEVAAGDLIYVTIGAAGQATGYGARSAQGGVASVTFFGPTPTTYMSTGGQGASSTSVVQQSILAVTSEGVKFTAPVGVSAASLSSPPGNIQYFEFTTPGTYSQTFPSDGWVDVVCIGGGGGMGSLYGTDGTNGGDSYFISPSDIFAGGGTGAYRSVSRMPLLGGSGYINTNVYKDDPRIGIGGGGIYIYWYNDGGYRAYSGGAGGFGPISSPGMGGYNQPVSSAGSQPVLPNFIAPTWGGGGAGDRGLGAGVGNIFPLTGITSSYPGGAGGSGANYGGGGAGNTRGNESAAGGGGGGTAYVKKVPVKAGTSYNLKVGAGGHGYTLGTPPYFTAASGAGGAVFIKFYTLTEVILQAYQDGLLVSGDLKIGGHIVSTSPQIPSDPTWTGSTTLAIINGNDVRGFVGFKVDPGPFTTSSITVSFVKPFTKAPTVILTWGSLGMNFLLNETSPPYVTSTTTGFTIHFIGGNNIPIVKYPSGFLCTVNYICL